MVLKMSCEVVLGGAEELKRLLAAVAVAAAAGAVDDKEAEADAYSAPVAAVALTPEAPSCLHPVPLPLSFALPVSIRMLSNGLHACRFFCLSDDFGANGSVV